MDLTGIFTACFLALFLLIALGALLRRPLALALRLGCNTALGFAALALLRATAAYTGVTLGVNLFNALTVGVLGIPGLVLLLLGRWVLL